METLPEEWCIKITKENLPIIQSIDFGSHGIGYNYTIGAYYGNKCCGDWGAPNENIQL